MGVKRIDEYRYRVRWKLGKLIPRANLIRNILIMSCGMSSWRYVRHARAYIKDKETFDKITNILLSMGFTVEISERPKGSWLYMWYDKYYNGTSNGKSPYAYINDFSKCLYDLITLHMDEFTTNVVRLSKLVRVPAWKIYNELGVPNRYLKALLWKLQDDGYIEILGTNKVHTKVNTYSIVYRVLIL